MTVEPLSKLIRHLAETHVDFEPGPLADLARDIASVGHERNDPVREIMARLGDRWSALLLFVLSTGRYRHAALRRIIEVVSAEKGISQRMLTLRLRALERDGLVERQTLPTVPPAVSYSLTPLGRELVEKLDDMITWIKRSEEKIRAARAAFEP